MPKNLDKMLLLAERLSKGLPFVRVDFYNASGIILFGELTFFPASGMGRFAPSNADEFIGNFLQIHLHKM